jgi:hypothetical protein
MKDRLSKYPGRVKLTPVAGQADTFDMIRADEPENEGTPLNKNSLLKDETAVELGLDPADDPTPDDALKKIMEKYDPKVGDVLETLRTDLGDEWLLCNGGDIPNGLYPELREIIPYSTEWKSIAQGEKYKYVRPMPFVDAWALICKIGTSSSDEIWNTAMVYNATMNAVVTIACPLVVDGTKGRIYGITHDGTRYVLAASYRSSSSSSNTICFYSSVNLVDWIEIYRTTIGGYSQDMRDFYFDGSLYLSIMGTKDSNTIIYSTDLGTSTTTKLTAYSSSNGYEWFDVCPLGYWGASTDNDTGFTMSKSGKTTNLFILNSNHYKNLLFFNDRYCITVPNKYGYSSNNTKMGIIDLETETTTSIAVETLITGTGETRNYQIVGVEYYRDANEWVMYVERYATSEKYAVYLSDSADPTDIAQYRVVRVETHPKIMTYAQMSLRKSQVYIESTSDRSFRFPNIKFLPTHDGDTYKYIYAGGAEE